jgi:phospholipid-transporting ATPase
MLNHDKLEQKAYPVKINEDNIVNDLIETNRISTSKYRWYNCIPKILVEQFSKMANIYFLLIAFMQVSNFDN